MPYASKIVLHCPHGLHGGLELLIQAFMQDGVIFVAVAGRDTSRVEDIIDEICVGDGSRPYSMLTSNHPETPVADVVAFAESLQLEFAGPVQVVEL